MTEQRLKSIIRMAMTTRLFREHEEGSHVGHSATSALIARDADTSAYATYFCKRTTPMVMGMTEAHRLWGLASMKPNETAYNAAFRTQLPFFEDIAQDEEREAEFARYMKSVRSSEGVSLKHLVVGFDWESVQRDGTVVDVSPSTRILPPEIRLKLPGWWLNWRCGICSGGPIPAPEFRGSGSA